MNSLGIWVARHAIVVWIGIVLNLVFAIPLLLVPDQLMAALGFPPVPGLWPRFAGLLLVILSVFYVPATIDFRRYELFAWLAVFPSRTFGTVFFAVAVFGFEQPLGFLIGTAIDGVIAILSLVCLIRIDALRREVTTSAVPA
jgi:hypothetical protein